jgi:GNAT superfamily N-acetyltransferase
MSADPNIRLRPATADDADSEDVRSLLPGSGDTTIVATEAGGARLGAVWTFHHSPPLVVGADGVPLPEITIAVVPEKRGQGIGGALLDELIARCTGKCDALTLNVHQRNPAANLYRCKGFRVTAQGRGALGTAMRKDLLARST